MLRRSGNHCLSGKSQDELELIFKYPIIYDVCECLDIGLLKLMEDANGNIFSLYRILKIIYTTQTTPHPRITQKIWGVFEEWIGCIYYSACAHMWWVYNKGPVKFINEPTDYKQDCYICYSNTSNIRFQCEHGMCSCCWNKYRLKRSETDDLTPLPPTCPFCTTTIKQLYYITHVKIQPSRRCKRLGNNKGCSINLLNPRPTVSTPL